MQPGVIVLGAEAQRVPAGGGEVVHGVVLLRGEAEQDVYKRQADTPSGAAAEAASARVRGGAAWESSGTGGTSGPLSAPEAAQGEPDSACS